MGIQSPGRVRGCGLIGSLWKHDNCADGSPLVPVHATVAQA